MDLYACQCRRASLRCQRSCGPEPALGEAEGFPPGFLGGNLGVESVYVKRLASKTDATLGHQAFGSQFNWGVEVRHARYPCKLARHRKSAP